MKRLTKSFKKPTTKLVAQTLKDLTPTERIYFFARLENPLWIVELNKHDIFNNPPQPIPVEDGRLQYPFWPELSYLARMTKDAEADVVSIISKISLTDNFSIYREILNVARNIKNPSSAAKIVGKVIEYMEKFSHHMGDHISKIIALWIKLGREGISAALKLAEMSISFKHDNKTNPKKELYKKEGSSLSTVLQPKPRFSDHEYRELLQDGIRPLASVLPLDTSLALINAAGAMIRYRFHEPDMQLESGEDFSYGWCQRVDQTRSIYPDAEEDIINTLTYASEKVYEKGNAEEINSLDSALRNGKWLIFQRIRYHLYAKFLNDQVKSWIAEYILSFPYDNAWEEFRYESQRMIRLAFEKYGDSLIESVEVKRIANKILEGQSIEKTKEHRKEGYNDQVQEEENNAFISKQLRPFKSVLKGDQKAKYDETVRKLGHEPEDSSYSPFISRGGAHFVGQRSPKTKEELKALNDDQLLEYLNNWNSPKNHIVDGNEFYDINYSGLGAVFKEVILENPNRFSKWESRWHKLENNRYISDAIESFSQLVHSGKVDHLAAWLNLCSWTLAQKDSESKDETFNGGTVLWKHIHRAVVDFVSRLWGKDVEVPLACKKLITEVLALGYNMEDPFLDDDHSIRPDRDDPLTDGINSLRGKALQGLVTVACWLKENKAEKVEIDQVLTILDSRITPKTNLKRPEYAVISTVLWRLYWVDPIWTVSRIGLFFPKDRIESWSATFKTLLEYTHARHDIFPILRDEYFYALNNIDAIARNEKEKRDFLNSLGEHLLLFYLWEDIEINATALCLDAYYKVAQSDNIVHLFRYMGRVMSNDEGKIEERIKNRAMQFFEWRLSTKDLVELQEFSFWLAGNNLDPEWKLTAYEKVLDIGPLEDSETSMRCSIQVEALKGLLVHNPDKVVKCFSKLIDQLSRKNSFYINTEDAKVILSNGKASKDPMVKSAALRAKENLLKAGHYEFLDV